MAPMEPSYGTFYGELGLFRVGTWVCDRKRQIANETARNANNVKMQMYASLTVSLSLRIEPKPRADIQD